jgi:protoporphyrinogen oxidase
MKYDCAIVGGGVAGLNAAYQLLKRGRKVVLIERGEDLGGLAACHRVGEFLIEKFYHHTFAADEYFFRLIPELGLESEVVWKYVSIGYRIGGRNYPLSTPAQILKFDVLSFWEKFRLGLTVLQTKTIRDVASLDRISAKDWLIRTAGRRVYDNFFLPLLNAKFGNGLEEISAAWMVSRIRLRSDRSHKGERLAYMKNSFQSVSQKLAERVGQNGDVRQNTAVEKIRIEGNRVTGVQTDSGDVEAEAVVSAVSPMRLRRLADLPRSYDEQLGKIRFQGTVCCLFGFDRPLTDIYWLNIKDDRSPFTLLVEHTNLFNRPEYGSHIVYCAEYIQNPDDPKWSRSPEEIQERYLDHLERMTPIKRSNLVWKRIAMTKESSPIYSMGYLSNLPPHKTPVEGLYTAGMMHSFPERSINDSLRQGELVARMIAGEI